MRVFSSLPIGTRRLYKLCALLAVGSSIWGYNIGILSSILIHPGWRSAMHDPTPGQKGIITGIYYLGTFLSYIFLSHPLADWKGRRYAASVGTAALTLGALFMASSHGGLAVGFMIFGRWLCGVGVGVVSTSVPLYQSEVAPAKERGKFVTMNHVGFVAGLATGLWVGYGMSYWTTSSGDYWGWRDSILLQLVPAMIFMTGLQFLPESPRWLVEKGDTDRASNVLHWLREEVTLPDAITHELHAISVDVESRHKAGTTFISLSLSLFREPSLFARLWRAFLLQFMAQMCGATAMKYYLPTLLKALGLEYRLALMAGAVEMTAKIGMTVVEMWVIDRFGRRACLVGGSLVMGIAMMVNFVLPMFGAYEGSKVLDIICIIFIFIYAMGYSLGLGPAAWVYSSEIFPTSVRARGLNFAASGGAIGSILVSQIWPLGNAKFGSGVYSFFMVVNFACVPIIWYLYPETKGRALEDMDGLFGRPESTPSVLLNGVSEDVEDGVVDSSRIGNDDEDEEDAPLLS